jgi:hypothetical protein
MAVSRNDKRTTDLPGMPKKRGRPPTGRAKSTAQRVAEHRARQAAVQPVSVPLHIDQLSMVAIRHFMTRTEGKYSLQDIVIMALRSQLVGWGYSFAQEDKGEVCYGGEAFK